MSTSPPRMQLLLVYSNPVGNARLLQAQHTHTLRIAWRRHLQGCALHEMHRTSTCAPWHYEDWNRFLAACNVNRLQCASLGALEVGHGSGCLRVGGRGRRWGSIMSS